MDVPCPQSFFLMIFKKLKSEKEEREREKRKVYTHFCAYKSRPRRVRVFSVDLDICFFILLQLTTFFYASHAGMRSVLGLVDGNSQVSASESNSKPKMKVETVEDARKEIDVIKRRVMISCWPEKKSSSYSVLFLQPICESQRVQVFVYPEYPARVLVKSRKAKNRVFS